MLYSIGLVLNSFFLFVCLSVHVLYYLVSRLNPMLLLCLFFKSYILVGNSSCPIHFFSGNNWGYTLFSVKVWCVFDTH